MTIPSMNNNEYVGALSGEKITANNGQLTINVKSNYGDIWLPVANGRTEYEPVAFEIKTEKHLELQAEFKAEQQAAVENNNENEAPASISIESVDMSKPYEEMTVAELQAVILAKMAKNGPVTDQMRRDVEENIYQNSLVNWAKSFR